MSEEGEVRERGAALGDIGIEAGDAGREGAKLRKQGADDSERRLDDGWVGGQGTLGVDGLDALVDNAGVPDAVGVEEGHEGLAASALGRLQRGPALKEGSEDVGLFVAEPPHDLREVLLEGENEAIWVHGPLLSAGAERPLQETERSTHTPLQWSALARRR
jgi:hypothetical protein